MIAATKNPLSALSNNDLVERLDMLVQKEREITLKLILHLIEMDCRRLYQGMGYGSLFEYCTRHFGYSESAANRRIRTARCVRDYPEVYELLNRNELTLTVVSRIAGILTAENQETLLHESRCKSKRQIEVIVARYQPKSILRDRVKAVYIKSTVTRGDGSAGSVTSRENSPERPSVESTQFTKSDSGYNWAKFTTAGGGKKLTTSSDERRSIQILEKKYKLEFAVNPEVMVKIEQAKVLLSTKFPGGFELEQLLNTLLDEYIQKHDPKCRQIRREKREASKKHAICNGKTNRKPSRQPVDSNNTRSRHIPAAVQDEVYQRDNGRCAFISPDGTKCNSTWNLQIDHIVPFAKGGDHSIDNLRLLCGNHNKFEAEKVYGREFIKTKISKVSRLDGE